MLDGGDLGGAASRCKASARRAAGRVRDRAMNNE